MPRPGRPRGAFRLPRRTLRIRLALLYATLFCASAVALAAVAVIFRPDFLMRTSSAAAPGTRDHPAQCCQHGQSIATITGTVAHDISQNPAGVAMVAIMLALAVGVGWLLAGRLVLPLRAITASARDISASNLHRRLGLAGHDDEFSELGQTLDDLFARLEASFESQRHFIANASHELRTPLTAGRALLQVAIADPEPSIQTLRATCQELVELGDQQERLIAALLTLANSQRGLEHPEPLDLADITQNVLLARQHEADRLGIRLIATLAAAPATGDPSLAESLVANLVDNAIRHNLPGGQAEITTALTARGAAITVSNTGTLIPEGELEALFQPFRQLGTQRIRPGDGHGLGLAIVRAIADAHGAALAVRPRPHGGLDMEVTFPDIRLGRQEVAVMRAAM
jgi:signal transduction histidine kinase